MSDEAAGHRALTLALVGEQALESHEKLCAERYNTINSKIDKLEIVVKWVGGLMATSIISVLAWSVSAQIDNAKAQQAAAALKIEMLQKQVTEATAGRNHMIDQMERIQPTKP